MRKLFFLFLLLAGSSEVMQAQITWNFGTTAVSGTAAVGALSPNITPTVLSATTQAQNVTTTVLFLTTPALAVPSVGYTGASASFCGNAFAKAAPFAAATSTYLQFVIAPTVATSWVNITAINWGNLSLALGGPTNFTLYSSVDNYTSSIGTATTTIGTTTWSLVSPTITPITGAVGTAVTIRIYGYGGTGTPSATIPNWRVDDVIISATAQTSTATVGQIPKYTGPTTFTNSIMVESNNKIGVGTATPSSTLDVNGTTTTLGFKMATGAAVSKVLTSDLNGVGTWQTVASGGTTLNGTGFVKMTGTTPAYIPLIQNADLANTAVASLSGVNTGDNATNSQYSGLVTNATHTGDASGATTLTVTGIRNTTIPALATGNLKYTGTAFVWDAATYLSGNQNISFTPTGDVTGTASGATAINPLLTINNNAVTFAKIQQIPTSTLIGRSTALTGNAETINIGTGLNLTAGTLTATSNGEANTASNVGTLGTGLFKQKAGVNLEFYKLNPANNKVSIALVGADRIDLGVTEANFTAIPNSALTNNSFTIGTTNIALGATTSTLAGLTSVASNLFVGALTGNATSATNLAGGFPTINSIPYQTGVGVTSMLAIHPSSGYVLTSTGSGLNWTQGVSGAGLGNYLPKFTQNGSVLGNSQLYDNGTNVGIGTSSPLAKLDVSGTIKITDGSQGVNKVLTSDASGLATWAAIPYPAATATAWGLLGNGGTTVNNFIGTTDAQNLIFKANNIQSGLIDIAHGNTAWGKAALQSLTSGNGNTAIGESALKINTLGNGNTSIGLGALQSMVYGNGITAIGAGSDVLNGGNYITNATAIGASAKVATSNSLVLGNNANVGIGTSSPTEKLEVVDGNIRTNKNIIVNGASIDSKVLIGNMSGLNVTSPTFDYLLAVNGSAIFTKAVVRLTSTWPDYVFEPTNKLPTLAEVEAYIAKHKHLQDVPSAAEVKEKGIDLGDNQTILLKKVEELTLYMIELNKKVEVLAKENEELKKKVNGDK
jgi:hypothetical protein